MPNQKIAETLTWQATSHIQPKRSPVWYIIFSVIFIALLVFAVYTKSPITFITFFLIMAVILILSTQPSREKAYKITKTAILDGNVLYPYKAIKKFWIVYNPPEVKTLNFETTAYLNNKIMLQLGNQDPVQVKLVLSQYLPEDLEMEESVADTLARRLKI